MERVIRMASGEDLDFVAWAMLQAARSHLERGFWDIMLARPEPECLEFLKKLAQTPTRSGFHLSRFLIAEEDGRPASALCGFEPREAGGEEVNHAVAEAIEAMGWERSEVAAMLERFAPLRTCHAEAPGGTWVIENVATAPESRRHGHVDALTARIIDLGRKRGHRIAQVSVLIGNDPAQQAYEKAGFTVADEKRHPDFAKAMGAPGMRRLVREL